MLAERDAEVAALRELVARLPAQVANLAAKAAELEEQLEAAVDGRAGEAAPKPLRGKDPWIPETG